jgi:hypothetical protein
VNDTDNNKTVEELKAELQLAQKRLELERAALKDATPIVWRFTIAPATTSHHEVFDETCVLYVIAGEVANKEEATSVGHLITGEGRMVYVFNTLSGKLVMDIGGGTVYVSKGWGRDKSEDAFKKTMQELSEFIVANPNGGDITDIINRHRAARNINI